jgi:type I restriction enzyme S subunit
MPYIAALQASTDSLRDGKSISYEQFGAISLPYPVPDEQRVIATFLDHETAKIDALIEKQQRLIELLKEKRQAVISHAVTKGLNPNAPMKDSGVEWLGEVPAHWIVAPLKRFAEVIDCKHYTVQFLDEGLPIVSIRELKDDLIDIANAKLTSCTEWNFLREGRIPQPGDLVFCRNASVGAAGYVNGDFDFCMGQDVCLIRTRKPNRYMHFQITSRHVREQIEAFLVGATIRRANVEEIRGLVVAHPPEPEQIEIAKYLENALSEFSTLSEKANRTVALLIERRTALISAAVTGKIDVRDWQAAA